MKTMKNFTINIVVVTVLLIQLMRPTLVHAEDETPPPASETPVETTTPPVEPTEIAPTESPTPAETESPTETPFPAPTEIIPVESPADSDPPTVDPVGTDTPTQTAVPAPAESTIETLPVESPPPDGSSTPDTLLNTPVLTATDSPIPVPSDSASPTTAPIETSTAIPTEQETVEPPSDTPESTSTPEPTESATETIAAESSGPTEAPTRERTPRPPETTTSTLEPTETALPTETVTVEPPALLEAVQAIPGETSVVVLDADGQPLPLVTQEAADIVTVADPMWCPAGAVPMPMGFPYFGSCTPSYPNMTALLANQGAFINAQSVNGTIWITTGNAAEPIGTTSITIDGSIFSNWANYSLTLQGGWNGAFGSTGILSNSVFSVPITIQNWNNGITIQNINAPSITISDATIQNNGISVVNVNAEVNLRRINVNRTNGVFGHGMRVITSGNINLEDITATANSITQGDGAFLDNTSGTGNVTLTGTNIFSNHHIHSSGMYIVSKGTVSLSNITSSNSGRGVNISQAGNVSITNGIFNDSLVNNLYVNNATGNVSLDNISIDGTNGAGTGLYVNTAGAINGNNISSNGNSYAGALLASAANITLTGTNVFNNNGSHGLYITNAGGTVEVNDITANQNLIGFGIIIENGAMGVTLNNAALAGNGAGMVAGSSSGTITLNGVNASNNWYSYGAELYGANGVSLTGMNIFDSNGAIGLFAESSNGTITQSGSLTADSNGSSGAVLSSAYSATLTGTNNFNNNGEAGLEVYSGGGITLNNVTVDSNGNSGAYLFSANGINLTGTNHFNNNGYNGLEASSGEAITLSNFTANSNGGVGISVYESGDVILNNGNASQNQLGVFISNSGNVYLTGENISNNSEFGLYVICVTSINFSLFPPNIINNPTDIIIDPTCPVAVSYPIPTIVSQSQGEFFTLDCDHAGGYSVILPNRDLVQIFCPVSGRASISRLDNTALPSNLPDGYTYASAFQADIVQGGKPISVIEEGGSIKASFVGSSLQAGSAYSILYWDNNKWVPLKDFMLSEKGNPVIFDLNPGVTDDTRKILSGVKLITVRGEPRVEVSTNFPGIFVLAQR